MPVTFDMAEAAVRTHLGEEAFAHSRAVADMAGLIATVYGLDVAAARLAGLLHDWHRELGPAELLTRARAAELPVTDAEEIAPYLLHAQTGAQELREVFPDLGPEVLAAIENHTLGDPLMAPLDKAVYVADMIEPGRDYQDVDDLREAVGTVALDDLFALCYQHSIAHLVATRKRLHPKTIDVWNALVARARQ